MARETFNLLQHETPAFILPHLWSPNKIVQLTTKSGASASQDKSAQDVELWTI